MERLKSTEMVLERDRVMTHRYYHMATLQR